jgi:GH24 family phage-related lysozyme (muramidase)
MKTGRWVEISLQELVDVYAESKGLAIPKTGLRFFFQQDAVGILLPEPSGPPPIEELIAEDFARLILKKEEGEKYEVYPDSEGYKTAGIGHLITKDDVASNPLLDRVGTRVGVNQVKSWFNEDFGVAWRAAVSWIGVEVFNSLSPLRQALIVCKAFQLGGDGIKAFEETLAHLKSGEFDDVADHWLGSKWARQTPNRVARMAQMMRTGILDAYYK